MFAEDFCEILAGLKSAEKRDAGDAEVGLLDEQVRGSGEAAVGEVFRRGEVDEFPAVMGELGASEAAGLRHRIERPWFIEPPVEIFEKQQHRAFAAGQGFIELGIAGFEQFREQHDQFVDEDFEARLVGNAISESNGFIDAAEATTNLAVGVPNRLFVVAQHVGESMKASLGEEQPVGPRPRLVRAAHPDVEDQPGIMIGGHIGVSDAVSLPGPGDGEIAGMELVELVIDMKRQLASGKVADFEAFIAMPVEPPMLREGGIPVTGHQDLLELMIRQASAGIAATTQRLKLEVATQGGLLQRLAGVRVVKLAGRAKCPSLAHGINMDIIYQWVTLQDFHRKSRYVEIMNRLSKILSTAGVAYVAGLCGLSAEEEKLRVLVLSGANNHDWRTTTPEIKAALEETGRFEVDVEEDVPSLTADSFAPYAVILSNFNTFGPDAPAETWDDATKQGLMDHLAKGHGLVIVHAGSSVFYDWPEFQQLACGTWAGDTSHGHIHISEVTFADSDSPITRGLEPFWIRDEFWQDIQVAAGATALASVIPDKAQAGTGKPENILFKTQVGAARGFANFLGHDAITMKNTAWRSLLQRGTEWAATGKVTLAPPEDWPATREDAERMAR